MRRVHARLGLTDSDGPISITREPRRATISRSPCPLNRQKDITYPNAIRPNDRGSFTAIQHDMTERRPLSAAFMENETQVPTIGRINLYARLGFRYLRPISTLHFAGDRLATDRVVGDRVTAR